MSPIEKKWPFVAINAVCTVLTTMYIMGAAGMPSMTGENLAQGILYFFCFFGVHRTYSFLGWLLVLWISPKMAGAVRVEAERP